MSDIDKTLAERGNRYGEFNEHAEITQRIKDAMVDSNNWDKLDDDMKEALEMVAHKIGRILNGDPYYIDSWTDIIGYTRLVEKRLIAEQPVVESEAYAAAKAQIIAKAKADSDPGLEECDCVICSIIRSQRA